MCQRDSLWHEEYCLNNATDRNLEVNFSYNKNLQMHITFQNQLPTSNYQDLQNMWNVTVEKRPYAAISKLLSLCGT